MSFLLILSHKMFNTTHIHRFKGTVMKIVQVYKFDQTQPKSEHAIYIPQ